MNANMVVSERAKRDSFRSSILPVFYFRNIVRTIRPSLIRKTYLIITIHLYIDSSYSLYSLIIYC